MLEKNSESKYVLFTPVGGNDPVGDEYYKDDMIEEINKKLVEGKISQDKADKLITYIESKRNKEPILMEGAILHIVRHYKPDCVILVFTNTVKEVEIKYNVLSEKIKELSKSCEVLKIEDFNKDYVYSWEYNIDFNEKLKNIPEKYSKHNILVNITSSTPQMNLKLSLETLNNYKLIPVQVLVSLNDLHTGKNVQKDFSKVYSDYEEIIKRCVEPNIYSIRKPKIKSQIHSLIASGDIDENGKYNYITAYNLFKNDRHIRKDLIKKIEEAKERVNLNYTNNRKIEEDKLKYMNIFREYYFVMKIKKIKGEMSDFILRITPFITELFYYFLSNLNIKDLKDVFIKNKNESYINVFEIKNNTLKNEIFYTKLRNYIKHAKLENKYKNIQYLSLDIKNIDTMIEDLYKKIEVLFLKLKSDNNGFKDLFKIAASLYGSIKNPTFNKYKIIDNIKDLMKYKDKSDEVNDICNSYNKIKSKREILDIADKYVSKNDYATIQYLLIIFKYYNNNYLSIYNLFKEFRDIESKVRNNIAHNLISITEDDIIYNVGLSSDRILYKCDELFQLIFKNDLSPAEIGEDGRLKFDYNCIINKDIETLLIDPLEK